VHWLNLIQIASVVGLIVAGGFAGLQRGSIMNLRETVADLRGRRDDLEKDREELTKDLDRERQEKSAKIAELEGAVRVLTDTVTAKEAITDLQSRLDVHHKESMAVLTAIQKALTSGGV
jgi:predicted nuclease with TOPRIM domain